MLSYNENVSVSLFRTSRPRFWIYIFGPFLIGLASASSLSTDLLRPDILLAAIYFLFPANLFIYGVNDIFDYETDRLNPKKSEYETRVTPDNRRSLALSIAVFNLPFIAASLFRPTAILLPLLGFLFLSFFYSSPPIRAKTKPILDSVFNILYVFPGIVAYRVLSGTYPPIALIIGCGLWTMAMHAYSAIPDIEPDRKVSIKTIATLLNAKGTLLFCGACYVFASIVGYRYIGIPALILGLVYVLVVVVSFALLPSKSIFQMYRFFPFVNAMAGFVVFWVLAYPKLIR